MTYEHRDIPADKGANHVPYDWTYANAAARTEASGFVSADVGKLARQTDNNTLWMLTATTPTWLAIGAGSTFVQTLLDDTTAATARATLGANIARLGAMVSLSTTQTLTADHLGKHLSTTGSATLTVPQFSVCENGSIIYITCYSGTTTIARNGSEALYTTASIESFTLEAGQAAILVCNGTNSWVAQIIGAGSSGGGWELVSVATISDDAYAAFTGLDPTTYDYELSLINIYPAVDGDTNYLKLQFEYGTTWVDAGGFGTMIKVTDVSVGTGGHLLFNGTAAINGGWEKINGKIEFQCTDVNNRYISGMAACAGMSGNYGESTSISIVTDLGSGHALNGVRVLATTGNLTSGSVVLRRRARAL